MISINDVGDVCVLKVDAVRLDSAVGTVIRNSIISKLETQSKFVVDLSQVKLVDSGGLGSLVAILKNTTSHGGQFSLCSMQKSVRLMFELSRMDRQFMLYENVDLACDAMR